MTRGTYLDDWLVTGLHQMALVVVATDLTVVGGETTEIRKIHLKMSQFLQF